MDAPVKKFLQTQAWASGLSNAVLNALFFYALNRENAAVPYADAAVDAVITCGFVSFLVALPTAYFTKKARRAGLFSAAFPLLDRLPSRPARLACVWWGLSALAVEGALLALYAARAFAPMPFGGMLALRFAWCGLLGAALGVATGARYLRD